MKQTNSFQRWKRRYFKLRGRTLYYAQTSKVTDTDAVTSQCGRDSQHHELFDGQVFSVELLCFSAVDHL